MSDSDPRIAALIAEVAALEAAVSTGSTTAVPSGGYPFLSKLSGEALIAAQTAAQENAALRKRLEELEGVLEERDYRITHLKRSLERLLPASV
jgi:hypothetical protein